MVSMFNNVLLPRKMLVSVGTIALLSVGMLSCNDTGVVSGLKISIKRREIVEEPNAMLRLGNDYHVGKKYLVSPPEEELDFQVTVNVPMEEAERRRKEEGGEPRIEFYLPRKTESGGWDLHPELNAKVHVKVEPVRPTEEEVMQAYIEAMNEIYDNTEYDYRPPGGDVDDSRIQRAREALDYWAKLGKTPSGGDPASKKTKSTETIAPKSASKKDSADSSKKDKASKQKVQKKKFFSRTGLRAFFGKSKSTKSPTLKKSNTNSPKFPSFPVGKFTVQRMNTAPDGNCGIHASSGDWLYVPTKDDPSKREKALVAGGGTEGARKLFAEKMKENREAVAKDWGIKIMLLECQGEMRQFEQNERDGKSVKDDAAVAATADMAKTCGPIFRAMKKLEQKKLKNFDVPQEPSFAASDSLVPVLDNIFDNTAFAELYVDAISESDTYYLRPEELTVFGEVSGRPVHVMGAQRDEHAIRSACEGAKEGKIVVRHSSNHYERVRIWDDAGNKCWTDDLEVVMAF